MDYDYINHLSEEEKLFLAKFNAEYYNVDFRHVDSGFDSLHDPDTDKKALRKTDYARRVDIMAVPGELYSVDQMHSLGENNYENLPEEDILNAIIDNKETIIRKRNQMISGEIEWDDRRREAVSLANSRNIVNTETGEIYRNARAAAKALGKSVHTIRNQLKNPSKNKTNLVYLDQWKL